MHKIKLAGLLGRSTLKSGAFRLSSDLFTPALVASLVAAGIASAGIIAVVMRDSWAIRNAALFVAFAAGVLVTTALTLFPEALAASRFAPFSALAGYLLLYGINSAFRRSSGAIFAPIAAIGLHSFIDGLEYGILFDHDLYTGIVASIGLISHEFAEGVILFTVLRASGCKIGVSVGASFLAAAVTTPLGAIASQPVLNTLDPVQLGNLLAAAAGALLYVGATHLPTHLTDDAKGGTAAAYIGGVALALLLSLLHGGEAHQDLPDAAAPGQVLHEHHDR